MMTAGDEGFVKVVQSSVWSRTDETDPKERLSPLVPLIQEFHARQLGISCNREEFDLQNQIRVSQVEQGGGFNKLKYLDKFLD